MRNSEFQKMIYESEKDLFAYEKEIIKKNQPRLKKVRQFLKEEGPGKKILELGCATALLTKDFVKENKVYGLDLAENLLSLAKKRGLSVKTADLTKKLPFPNSYFDLIVASEVLEHIIDTDHLLSETNRLLKPKGKIIITFPNIRNIYSFLLLLFNHPPVYAARYRSPHVRDFTYPLVKKALKNNGFQVIKKTGSNLYLPGFWRLANSFPSRFLAGLFPTWAKEIIIKAKKVKSASYPKEEIIKSYKRG